MKAQDFITERDIKVSIPINITIPQDGGNPKISVADKENSPGDDEEQKVMVSPLQQEVELAKAAQGKESSVIDDLTDDDEQVESDVTEQSDELEKFKALLKELK